MSNLKTHIARKRYRCDLCSRLIPVGVRYWRRWSENGPESAEHTNCEEFRSEPVMPPGFNQNRS